MLVVLTNDDGCDAPGLAALHRAVCALDDVEIDIIAPAAARSGQGHAVSAELRCHRREIDGLANVTAVEGTPADCVRLAVSLPGRRRPDWVVAGINRGANLGVDVYYSGTVAAAREAAIIGIPAIAVSQLVMSELPDDWERTTREAAAVIAALIHPDHSAPPDNDHTVHARTVRAIQGHQPSAGEEPPPPCWNVNLPKLPADQPPIDVQITPISTDPLPLDYTCTDQDDQTTRLEYAGNYHQRTATPGTDVAAVFAGAIAISPLRIGS